MALTPLSGLLAGLAMLGLAVEAAPTRPDHEHRLERRAPATALVEHTLPLLRRSVSSRIPRPYMDNPMLVARDVDTEAAGDPPASSIGVGPALAASQQIEYISTVTAGSNTLQLIVDTGSSDTWFVKEGFTCLDVQYRQPAPASVCDFGPAFKGDFPGGQITDQHFNVTYGTMNGPFLNGLMGYADIIVPKQQIGLATFGAWSGDGITSGILGLGLPGLTAAYQGIETTNDGLRTAVEYSPLVSTLAQNNMTSVFSLALSRDPDQSFLAFGGVPAGVQTDGEWTTAKLVKINLRNHESRYMYYQIHIDKAVWNSSQLSGSESSMPDMIVDSGTTMNLFPFELARSINSMFTPRAVYDPQQQAWFVNCSAKPPTLGIQIGGKMLYTDPSSMILPQVRHPLTGQCVTGIGVTNGFPYILGDTFMQQLVTVFDINNMEIKFAHRPPK